MRAAALAFLLATTACQGAGGPAGQGGEPFPLRTLDDSSAAALRRDFDAASGQARYVVALSPT